MWKKIIIKTLHQILHPEEVNISRSVRVLAFNHYLLSEPVEESALKHIPGPHTVNFLELNCTEPSGGVDAAGRNDMGSSLQHPDLALTSVLWPGYGGLLRLPLATTEGTHRRCDQQMQLRRTDCDTECGPSTS